MEISKLEAFVTVATERNFTASAKRLHLSQSAVSVRVASLEHELNVLLFRRKGRYVELTDAGAKLLPDARKILGLLGHARDEMMLNRNEGTELSLGCANSALASLLPEVVTQFFNACPAATLLLRSGSSLEIRDMVLDNVVEIGLVSARPPGNSQAENPALNVTMLGRDDTILVAGRSHPLASHARIEGGEITHHRLVAYRRASTVVTACLKQLRESGVDWDVSIYCDSYDALRLFLYSGMFVGIMPRCLAEQDIAKGFLVPLPLAPPLDVDRHMALILPRGLPLSKVATVFIQLIRAARYDPSAAQAVSTSCSQSDTDPTGSRLRGEVGA